MVVATNTTMLSTWSYDEADLTSFVPAGTLPVAAGTPVSVDNSQIPNSDWATVIPAGSGATTAYLYPFSTQYGSTPSTPGIWYGDCLGEAPATPNTLQATEGGTALLSMGGLDGLAYEVTKPLVAGSPLAGATATATMVNDDPSCPNDTVTPVATNASGISQTGVVVDWIAEPTCTLHTNPMTCGTIQAADDGKQVSAPGLPSNAYVYNVGSPAPGDFTLSSSPVASQPITVTPAITNFDVVGETYNVTVTDPGPPVHTATTNLMVNPNGVIKWGILPAGTFSQYPLTGTALTIPVA
jgi:hypothetical protein